jgi:protein-disulfide isomerase
MFTRRSLHVSLASSLVLMACGFAPAASAVAQQTSAPSAPAPSTAAPSPADAPHFPPVDERNFTAATPTRAEVESFLKSSWGYDSNRTWEVFAIQKTAAPGVSRVLVFVAEKSRPQIANLNFFITPDGHHLISGDSLIPFGAHPFAEARQTLEQRANGPYEGSASHDLELVEFADFECPHCKAAQPTIKRLIQDFPQAHFVFQNFPLVNVHDQAFKAAAYGHCVAKAGGNAAFFKYADDTFANQEGLTPENATQTLAHAVTAAGQDPAKIAACAASPATKTAIDADLQLAKDMDVNETPTLFIDGRPIPVTALPYEQLKAIVQYQFSLDKGE